MRLPELTPLKARREIINRFAGYNHRDVILDGANNDYASGEWYDCNNLTSDKYPTAAVRGKRGEYYNSGLYTNVLDLFNANGAMGYVTQNSLCIKTGDVYTCFTLPGVPGTAVEDRRVVTMGAYVIVFPDKFYVNSADPTDYGFFGNESVDIESTNTARGGPQSEMDVTPWDVDGNSSLTYTAAASEPQTPTNGDYWYDTRHNELLQYFEGGGGNWSPVSKQYVKISFPDVTLTAPYGFEDGLMLNIKYKRTYFVPQSWVGREPQDGYHKLIKNGLENGHPYMIFEHPFGSGSLVDYEFSVSWDVPDMDYVIECQNRLWGCKYGYVDGEKINEIYASALGSFKEWRVYEGTSMDSYTASIGSDGPFIGAIKYNDNPIFFKERYMHKVYGSYPAQYQINTTECAGVEDGSWKSVAVNNGVAFWNSPFGIMAYDGASPVKISDAFGSVKYKNAVGGVHDGKYYVSMQDDGDEWYLFTYDISRRFWLKENGVHVRAFCTAGDELYMAEGTRINTLNGSGTLDSYPVNWYAETGDLGLNSPDRKYVSRLTLRLKLAVGTWVKIWLKYDDVEWEWVGTCAGHKLDTFSLPVSVKRCDHFRLKLEGCGDAQIYSITRTVEGGSDL